MIRFFTNLPLHFKSALHGLVRHSSTAFSAISAVSVTLVLMSLFMLLTGNVDNFTANVEDGFKIQATIDNVKTEEEIITMQEQIEQISGVKTIEFSSQEQELNYMIELKPEMFSRYVGDINPMRNTFIVEVYESKQIESVTSSIGEIEGIEKAQYGGDGISIMIQVFESLRNGGFIFVVVLSMLAIFLISNTIRMTIYARKVEIGIMRNVGAANGFIRTPFIIEGMFIGLIGAILPVALTYFGYSYLYNMLGGFFLSSMFIMKPVSPFVETICLVLTGCGILVGMLGSFLAVTKYLRWRR